MRKAVERYLERRALVDALAALGADREVLKALLKLDFDDVETLIRVAKKRYG